MTYEIYSGDTLVNTIVADGDFVSSYCEANGYTYAERVETPAPEPTPHPPTELEQLRADVDYLSVMTGVMLV